MVTKQPTFEVSMLSTDRYMALQRPTVYTNDVKSVEITFKVLDIEDLSPYSPQILLYMRDGSFYQITEDVTTSEQHVSYVLKGNEGKHSGIAQSQLVLVSGDKELASPKCEFRIVTGLDNVVATEVMIQDWTTLLKEAREYLVEMEANEGIRQSNEDERKLSETTRVNSETERQSNEGERQSAEILRETAEGERVELFQDMQLTHNLDSGKSYKTNLEIKDGRPRLKLEEV